MRDEIGHGEVQPVADFSLLDYQQHTYSLEQLMGTKGLLLGFIGDIWLPANVRRIQWLQRYATRIQGSGVGLAALISNEAHTLYNFYISSPIPPTFPLLADYNRAVHLRYQLDFRAALLLIDAERKVRDQWLAAEMDKETWLDFTDLQRAIAQL
jgi:peroxiredoxin